MRRRHDAGRGRGLARLLLVLLLVQWAAATAPHARALVALGGAVWLELCGAHGTRGALLDRDGRPVEPDAAGDCCELCPAPAALVPRGPDSPPLPVVHGVGRAAPVIAAVPPRPARAPSQLPRAPPAG